MRRKSAEAAEQPKPALPKPDFNAPVPHPDDFAAWCEHPVTRFVAATYQISAKLQMDHWLQASWLAGTANPDLLIELRARADAYNAFLETPMDRYERIFTQDE